MKKYMKRIVSLAAAAAMVLTLCACGGGGGDTKTQAPGAETKAAGGEEKAGADPGGPAGAPQTWPLPPSSGCRTYGFSFLHYLLLPLRHLRMQRNI